MRFGFLFWVFLFLSLSVHAQEPDTTLVLPGVEVTAPFWQSPALGQTVERPDSLARRIPLLQTAAEVLASSGLVYLKNYGPGQLSTLSQGGGSASQTAILWNGIPVQSPLLGQFDLSLLPAGDMLFLTGPGGGPALTSGDLAGALHLVSPLTFGNRWKQEIAGSLGDFRRFSLGGETSISRPRFANHTRFLYQDQANNFPYLDLRGREVRQKNAHFRQGHILQENAWKAGEGHRIESRLWYQQAGREIPPLIGQRDSEAFQEDRAFRAQLAWDAQWNAVQLQVKTAYLWEELEYNDILAGIDSRSRAWNSWSEATFTHSVNRKHSWAGGVRLSVLGAQASNFDNNPLEYRPAAFLSWTYRSFSERLRFQLRVRQEWRNQQRAPFSPYAGLEWRIGKGLLLNASGTYAYRLPTFNDLYWTPGGNPDLVPEQGWAVNGGMRWIKQWGQFVFQPKIGGFSRWVDNWIIWLPDQGVIWSPQNIKKVWSRGANVRLKAAWRIRKGLQLATTIGYDWVRSTNEETLQNSQRSIGQQLIYVPIHQGRMGGALHWKDFTLSYVHLWIGKVFVLADNSRSLPAFDLGELNLSYRLRRESFSLRLNAMLHNLWNQDYVVVLSRPMPGIYYQFRVQFSFHKSKS